MSLYQRIRAWIRGRQNLSDDGSQGEHDSVFRDFPMELYGEIFKYMDVQSLKACKSVCFNWTLNLSHSDLLNQKSISVMTFDGTLTWNMIKLYFRMELGLQILSENFRLNEMNRGFSLSLFGGNEHAFEYVTHLEIVKSHIVYDSLRRFDIVFKNLVSLTMHDVYLEDRPPFCKVKLNLKKLNIYIKDRWEHELNGGPLEELRLLLLGETQRTVLLTPAFLGSECCEELEECSIQLFDSGLLHNVHDDHVLRNAAFSWVTEESILILRRNSKTLKSFAFTTFNSEDDRIIDTNHYGQLRQGDERCFVRSLNTLEEHFPELNFLDLRLVKLTLVFRLVQTGLPVAQRIFLPFLRSQTALREFSLSQLYFPGDGENMTQDLLDCLPPVCRTNLEGVMTLGPSLLQAHQMAPVPAVMILMANDPPNPIMGYSDSTVELKAGFVSLKLNFVFCQSLDNIAFFTRNIQFLTKIKIQQTGAHFCDRIVVGDGDLQRIVTRAKHLTEFWLEFCNLSSVTDFGLTGIHSDAAQRMLITGDYNQQDGDLIGTPISELKNLRTLSLTKLGNLVTDVSAFHAFKTLASLSSFGISKSNMTRVGIEELRRLFQYNKVIRFDSI